jgi:prepilin-type processing-associated H-X9-DG protein/prepilin-type N-terminal cleavage/methylation domain-containing protein
MIALHAHPAVTNPAGRKGFTLIELLIIIAIIVLLAAILFPVFARAREKARSAACQSNLKQIALAFTQYTADYDERLPHAWDTDTVNAPGSCTSNCYPGVASTNEPAVWPAKIEPYLKDRDVFTCPDATRPVKSPCSTTAMTGNAVPWKASDPVVGARVGNWYLGASQVQYGYNTYFLGGDRFEGQNHCNLSPTDPKACGIYCNGIGAALSSIAEPSGTVLVCDNYYANNGSGSPPAFLDVMGLKGSGNADAGDEDFGCRADGTTADVYDSIPARHSGGLNVAFVDGHVKWMKKSALMYDEAFYSCSATSVFPTWTDPKFLWNRF